MQLPLTGRCQCGAVRYEISATPATVYACHCRDCQRQTGGAFALSMIVPRAAVAIAAGRPREWLRPGAHAASGTPMSCFFCGDCGARLYHLPSRFPDLAVVKPGTLDDTSWLAPVGHIWTQRAQPGSRIPADGINYPLAPPDLSRLIAAWRERHAV